MNRFAELRDRGEYKVVYKFFRTDETLEEARARNRWRTDIDEIILANDAPEEAESGWLYFPEKGLYMEPTSSDPIEKQLYDLDERYKKRLDNISLAFVAALMDGDLVNQERLKVERQEMIEKYLSKRSKIVGS